MVQASLESGLAHVVMLPNEITDHIVDFLHDNKPALAACSLSSKALAVTARFHLFKKLKIALHASNDGRRFLESFPASQFANVEELEIAGPDFLARAYAQKGAPIVDRAIISYTLHAFPNLHSFTLREVLLGQKGQISNGDTATLDSSQYRWKLRRLALLHVDEHRHCHHLHISGHGGLGALLQCFSSIDRLEVEEFGGVGQGGCRYMHSPRLQSSALLEQPEMAKPTTDVKSLVIKPIGNHFVHIDLFRNLMVCQPIGKLSFSIWGNLDISLLYLAIVHVQPLRSMEMLELCVGNYLNDHLFRNKGCTIRQDWKHLVGSVCCFPKLKHLVFNASGTTWETSSSTLKRLLDLLGLLLCDLPMGDLKSHPDHRLRTLTLKFPILDSEVEDNAWLGFIDTLVMIKQRTGLERFHFQIERRRGKEDLKRKQQFQLGQVIERLRDAGSVAEYEDPRGQY